jgi:hypothetical protein
MTKNQTRHRLQIPATLFPYTAEELCFESQGVSLCGTLTMPTGSGPHTRDDCVRSPGLWVQPVERAVQSHLSVPSAQRRKGYAG